MAKQENSRTKATSQQDARLPATTRHNINEPPEEQKEDRPETAKDINVVRGDDQPQAVRHGG